MCSTDNIEEQEQHKADWLECIDHHDVDRITGPIGCIAGVLQMIDRMDPAGRDEAFEKSASEWLDVIGT